MATLDNYARQLGLLPIGGQMLYSPLAGPFGAPMPPFSGDPAGFAMPMMGGEMAESEMVDPMLGVTPAFGSTTTAGAQYGYSPQPRPALPEPIAADAAGLYGPFRGVWEQMQAQSETDPLAALMSPAPAQEQSPFMLRAQPQQAMQGGTRGGMPMQPSPAERMMRERGYGRAVDRINWLRGLRAQQGY